MEKNNYWKRNRDNFGSRNHLLFLWASFSYHFGRDEVDESNASLERLEKYLPFKDEEEHQKWLEIGSSFKFWEDFESFTKTIIDRVSQQERDKLILSYEQVAKDVCYCCDFKKVFDAFEKLTKWVRKIQDFKEYWKQLCKDEWELQIFLENYKETFGDYLDIKELVKSKTLYGFEETPSCLFFKDNLESKSDLMECIFERYAMGLDDEECLDFFKALIKELLK